MDKDLQDFVLAKLELTGIGHDIMINSKEWRVKGVSFTVLSQIEREKFLEEIKKEICTWDNRLLFEYAEVDNGVYDCLVYQKRGYIKKCTTEAKTKRKYNLPKYICYDMAESRNREYNVFQIQLHIDGKLVKTYKRTVRESVMFVVNKMVESKQWDLNKATEYMGTYSADMENGEFIPSNTPKSPSWRKREKTKNIKTVKEKITDRLKDILKFAKENNIDVDINVK